MKNSIEDNKIIREEIKHLVKNPLRFYFLSRVLSKFKRRSTIL